jgi:peptidoglycan/xylan/chitin deacetylase (PgdA/CDA1 family)
MNPLRRTALGLYQLATWSHRKRLVAELASEGRAPVCGLFYHREADNRPNPWTIPTRDFRRHLDWLGKRFDFVSFGEAQRRVAERDSRRPSVFITFDDGYGDNCDTAIPLLVERRIPTTYFVSTRFVRDQTPFPHDVARGEPLRPNTITELRAMANNGIELGAHTRTHADLGVARSPESIVEEVLGAAEDLSEWTGRRVRYFAFPYGQRANLNSAAAACAYRAGIKGVCSAYGGYNIPPIAQDKLDGFHLRRIHGDQAWARFTNWMSIDPRRAVEVDHVDDELLSGCLAPAPAGALAEGVSA